jgi:cell wall-associated NlpC family hydrolase
MTDTSTSAFRRPLDVARRAFVVLVVGAGVALSPLPASAHVPGPLPPPTVPVGPIVAPTAAAQVAVDTALAQLGDPYVWGAAGPDAFDCSGLTSYAYAAAGIALPHSSRAQSTLGTQVSRAELQAGDLVFFYTPISHVGLYIGDGMMVHARTFGQPVAVTSVDQAGYRFARRIVGP